MSDDDIINLDERRPARGRPPKSEATKSDFMKPCTVSFLASVLRKDKRTIERKLAGVAPVAREGKSDLYDFSQACEAVFRSETGLSARALANLDPTQLPPNTQSAFWSAQNSRAAYYRDAGDLWRSEDIEAALDAIVRVFRDSILALPEKLKAAAKSGKTPQDVAYAVLEAVENQAEKSVSELKGESFNAETLLFEEQMAAQDLTDDE
ncbi:DUF1441 family protein [Paracoccus versutus]|uniref:DUF1441 family protein n=1 Tax=Paracoccus versutus TaxID=34007 RepID=UPI000DF75BA6|nr:DUF1441 family protein [Paracoccus versutus]RDD72894.1 DUF1441 family protein [Paracoccus versutus]